MWEPSKTRRDSRNAVGVSATAPSNGVGPNGTTSMSDKPAADLSLIARQQEQTLSEMGTLRDDMGVMIAILQRLDGTVSGLVNEVRAMHSRLDKQVCALESDNAPA